jgi:hypothetical protein
MLGCYMRKDGQFACILSDVCKCEFHKKHTKRRCSFRIKSILIKGFDCICPNAQYESQRIFFNFLSEEEKKKVSESWISFRLKEYLDSIKKYYP